MKLLHTLLILGRISNLPTVWSNILCAWFLCEQIISRDLFFIALIISLVYIGGMYLNDYLDADFDEIHCSERPIPSGKINKLMVLVLGLLWMVGAILITMILFEHTSVTWLALLVAMVCIYNWIHKKTPLAILAMGGCRFLIYPMTASIFSAEVSVKIFWAGLGMFLYIVGLSGVARSSNAQPVLKIVSVGFILVSITLVFLTADLQISGMSIISLVALLLGAGYFLFVTRPISVGTIVEGLLAGIILLDFLKVSWSVGIEITFGSIFIGLFLLSLLAQRKIPAN